MSPLQLCVIMVYLIKLWFNALHSEEQGVILQVKASLVKVLVRDELLQATATAGSFSLCDTSTGVSR